MRLTCKIHTYPKSKVIRKSQASILILSACPTSAFTIKLANFAWNKLRVFPSQTKQQKSRTNPYLLKTVRTVNLRTWSPPTKVSSQSKLKSTWISTWARSNYPAKTKISRSIKKSKRHNRAPNLKWAARCHFFVSPKRAWARPISRRNRHHITWLTKDKHLGHSRWQ